MFQNRFGIFPVCFLLILLIFTCLAHFYQKNLHIHREILTIDRLWLKDKFDNYT